MAVRIDASGDKLYRTANLPALSGFTIAGWGYRHSAQNGSYRYFAGLEDATSNANGWLLIGWVADNAFQVTSNATTTNSASSPAASTWFYWFIQRSGTTATIGYKTTGDSWVTTSTTGTLSWTPAVLDLGNDSYDEWTDISLERVRVWDAALTTGELDSEMVSPTVVRTSNLRANWPLTVHTDLTDSSGNGYDLSSSGTLSTTTPGPFSGTTYNSSPSGSITPSGVLIRAGRKAPVGGITPTGAIIKASTKTFAGSITPTGTPTKQTSKTFTGGLTPAGVLSAVKTALVSISGAITPTGALILSTGKTLAGSITPTGALIRDAAKTFVGSVTPTGAALKQVTKTFAGALTPTGETLKQAGKTLAGSVTPTGAIFRDAGKVVVGAITPTGALVRSIGKILAGALTPSGSASGSKSSSVPSIVSGYTEAGNASNSTTLVINTPTHADGDKIYIVYVTDADSPTTASVSGSGWTTLEGPQDVSSSSVSTAGVMYVWYKTAASEGASYTITASNSERAVAISFAVHGDNGIDAEATYASGTDTSAEVGAVTTTVANTLRISAVVSQGVRTVSTLTNHTLLATHSYTSAGTISVQYKTVASAGSDAGQTATLDAGGWGSHAWAIKPSSGTNYTASLSGALVPAGAIIRSVGKVVAGSVTPTGAIVKAITKTFAGALTPTGAVVRQTNKVMAGVLTPVGGIFRTIGKVLAGVLGLSGAVNPVTSIEEPVDVSMVDAAVTVCSLSDAAVTAVTLGDSAVTTVVLTDATT